MKTAAGIALTIAVLAASTGMALAGTRTHAHVYRPFTASGQPAGHVTKTVRGSCWTGSLAADRRDAWRCMGGNFIYDPCFSSSKAHGVVLCAATGPWSSDVIKFKLTKKLPAKFANKRAPSTHGLPWALVTTKGWKCRLVTGATTVADGKRANYACQGTSEMLWGSPERGSEPWKIYVAKPQAKHLHNRTGIRAAWF